MEIYNEYHDNVVKFIFHVGQFQELYEKEVAYDTRISKTQEFLDEINGDKIAVESKNSDANEKLTPIDFPEKHTEIKDRNNCVRLCSTNKCYIY